MPAVILQIMGASLAGKRNPQPRRLYNRTRGEPVKQPKYAAAVVLIRKRPHLEVFWVRRSPHLMFQGGFYAFPGGQLDSAEDDRVCAARELMEEVGVRVDPASLVDIGRWI